MFSNFSIEKMFTQKLVQAFDLTNRRLVYVSVFFLLGLPIVGMIASAGSFQNPSTFNSAEVLKMLGFLILYGLFVLFAWPYLYGGMIGELANSSEGSTNWAVFRSWASRSYGKLLLFNILILAMALVILFLFVLIVVIGFLASGFSSPGDMGALQERLSESGPASGFGAFFGEVISTGLAEAFVLILAAAMIALVLTERGAWRSLGAGFKTFFTGSVFKFFLLLFLVFLFLNLLGVLIFNRPETNSSLKSVYWVVLILLQGYFSVFALSFLVSLFKPQEKVEILVAPTG